MNLLKTYRVQIIRILVFIFTGLVLYIIYNIRILNNIGIDAISKTQTTIYYLQLCFGVLLSYGALVIGYKQVNISSKQTMIAEEQTELTKWIFKVTMAKDSLTEIATNMKEIQTRSDNLLVEYHNPTTPLHRRTTITNQIQSNNKAFGNLKKPLEEMRDFYLKELNKKSTF